MDGYSMKALKNIKRSISLCIEQIGAFLILYGIWDPDSDTGPGIVKNMMILAAAWELKKFPHKSYTIEEITEIFGEDE